MSKKTEWQADGGHAWLVVPMAEARKVAGISSFSYVSPDGRTAYLEEDCDAALFISHYDIAPDSIAMGRYFDGDAPCRGYRRYPSANADETLSALLS